MIVFKKKKKILILVPARLSSTRLPKKVIKLINGKPLIVLVAERAKKYNLGKVVVASGDKKICSILSNYKIESYLTQKTHLSGTDRIFEIYDKFFKEYDLIVNLQGDIPYFEKNLIEDTLDIMNDPEVEIGTAACKLLETEVEDKNIVKVKSILNNQNQGYCIDFKRVIEKTTNFYHHIGIYVYSAKSLRKFVGLRPTENEINRSLEQMRALDNNMILKMKLVGHSPIGVDTVEDLKKIRKKFRNNENL